MGRIRAVAALLLAGWAGAVAARPATSPSVALDRCVGRLFETAEAQVDRNASFKWAERCPELAAVQGHPETAHLHPPFPPEDGETTLAQLLDIQAAFTSAAPVRRGPNLDYSGLPLLLEQTLEPLPEAEEGLWERLKAWLRAWLEENNRDPSAGWLADFLDGITVPDWVPEVIFKVSLAALFLLVLFIFFGEARAVSWRGLFHRRGREAGSGTKAGPRWSAEAPLEWEAILRLAPARQPVALFAYVIQLLTLQGLVAPDRTRTHGEYARQVAATKPALAPPLAELAEWADRGAYGPEPVDEAQCQRLRSVAWSLGEAEPQP